MKLADIIDTFITGDWGEESPTQDTPNAAYCVRGADIVPITNHNFTDIPQRYVCDRTKETKLLAAGDLVIEKSGGSPTQSTGRIVYVSEDLIKAKGNVVCSNFCTAFRVKAGWNPLYVYYFWQNVYNHGAFFNFEGKTSGIKNLQLDNALSAIDIEYLPLEKQNQIVASLASIDEKIKVNRQINDNLEAMAKQLYDYWFVQFDFPNEDGKPYKSSGGAMVWNEKLKREIPTSFDVKSLSEIIEVKDGTHDSPKPQDNGYFLLTSKHLTERGLDYASAYKISKEDYESINKRSKVDTNDILFSMIGTIGNSYFVEETNINFAIKNMALFKTSAKRWFSEYLYLYLSSCDYKHYEGNSLSGSIQKFVSLRTLRDMPILYHEDIIKVFAKEVRNIITMMVNLRKENIELTKQRDELLPLLMNGQATVNYHLSVD